MPASWKVCGGGMHGSASVHPCVGPDSRKSRCECRPRRTWHRRSSWHFEAQPRTNVPSSGRSLPTLRRPGCPAGHGESARAPEEEALGRQARLGNRSSREPARTRHLHRARNSVRPRRRVNGRTGPQDPGGRSADGEQPEAARRQFGERCHLQQVRVAALRYIEWAKRSVCPLHRSRQAHVTRRCIRRQRDSTRRS